MKHALDGYDELAKEAFAKGLWIDGTDSGGSFQGDAVNAPWVIFDIENQKNISDYIYTAEEARNILTDILKIGV